MLLHDLLLHHNFFCGSNDASSHLIHSQTAELLRIFVWPDGDALVRKETVEEEDLGRTKGGEEPLEGVAAVELAEEGA